MGKTSKSIYHHIIIAVCVVLGVGGLLLAWLIAVTFPDHMFLTCWRQDKQTVAARFGRPDETVIENNQETMVYRTGLNIVRLNLDANGRVWSLSVRHSD